MFINEFKNFNIGINKPNQNFQKQTPKFNTGVQKDTFQKSSPSFTGSFEEDLFKAIFGDMFEDMIEETAKTIAEEVVKHSEREIDLAAYIKVFSEKNGRNILMRNRQEKLQDTNKKIFGSSRIDVDYINKLFEEAGIRTLMGLNMFLQTYGRNPEAKQIFKYQDIEAVKIYGALTSKDDLAKFPELLLYLYNEEESFADSDLRNLNETVGFLKKVGLNNFDDFNKKFGHLGEYFNDFEEISDKADCINYLRITYDDKIGFLNEEKWKNPNIKNQDSEKIYASINDIVDYYYYINDGLSLDGISDILELAINQGKMKTSGLNQVSNFNNGFKTPEDKILFFEFLNESKVDVNEFNSLTSKSIISDTNVIANLSNKEYFSEKISQLKGIKKQGGFDFYKNYKDVINAICDEDSNSTDNLNQLFQMAETYNLKNSEAILQFYNRVTGSKNKNISTKDFKEFFELFKYPVNSLFAEAKKQNILPIEILKQEKARFEEVKPLIDEYKNSDETAYFAGQSALEIYKNYRESILENKDNIPSTLQNIAIFNIKDQTQYDKKIEHINNFATYFDSKQKLYQFFEANNIKFDGSKEEEDFIKNCLDILSCVDDDSEKSKDRIEFFTTSEFLAKSQNRLNELLNKTKDEALRKEVLSIIADKKIPSLGAMERFFKQYRISNSTGSELLSYLKNIPDDMDFEKNSASLTSIQSKFDEMNLPFQINGSNIGRVDVKSFKSGSTKEVIGLLNNLYGTNNNENFLSVMSSLIQNGDSEYSARKIAYELASKVDLTDESYQNISRLLRIDKYSLGLNDECSLYTYTKAIEQALPEDFVEFVNSNDWLKDENGNIPNVVLHARLRAIDRFALNEAKDISVLYEDETKEKLKKLFNTIYTTEPTDIRGTDETKRMIVDFKHGSNIVEAVFSSRGEMITVVQKRQRR